MKIFLLQNMQEIDYDHCSEMVVIADDESEARKIAKREACQEGKKAWDTASAMELGVYTGSEVQAFLVIKHRLYG